jgi:hypothetical protein
MATELRNRAPAHTPSQVPAAELSAGTKVSKPTPDAHPSGKEQHGQAMRILRGLSAIVYFLTCSVTYGSKPTPTSPRVECLG